MSSTSFTGEMAKKKSIYDLNVAQKFNLIIESLSNQPQLTDNSNLLFCQNYQVLPPIIRRHLRDIQASVANEWLMATEMTRNESSSPYAQQVYPRTLNQIQKQNWIIPAKIAQTD